jgi:hypothetical protein
MDYRLKKANAVEYRNGFPETSCKNIQNIPSEKQSNYRENRSNRNNAIRKGK